MSSILFGRLQMCYMVIGYKKSIKVPSYCHKY